MKNNYYFSYNYSFAIIKIIKINKFNNKLVINLKYHINYKVKINANN